MCSGCCDHPVRFEDSLLSARVLSRVCRLFATLWAVAHQAPPSMGFPRVGCHFLPWVGKSPWRRTLYKVKIQYSLYSEAIDLLKLQEAESKTVLREFISPSAGDCPSSGWAHTWWVKNMTSMVNPNPAEGLVEPWLPTFHGEELHKPHHSWSLSTFLASLDEITGHTKPGPFFTSFFCWEPSLSP